MNLDRVQPEQQVFAETAVGDLIGRLALVAEITRTFTRFVFDEPTRSISPVSSTRSSFDCRLYGTFAISSRNSVPLSASSKRPDAVHLGVRERALHVSEQFAFENAFGESAGVDGDQRLGGSLGYRVQRPGDHLFAGAGLAGDQHVGVGRTDPRDQLQHRLHRRRFGDHQRLAFGPQQPVFGFEPLALAKRLAERESAF